MKVSSLKAGMDALLGQPPSTIATLTQTSKESHHLPCLAPSHWQPPLPPPPTLLSVSLPSSLMLRAIGPSSLPRSLSHQLLPSHCLPPAPAAATRLRGLTCSCAASSREGGASGPRRRHRVVVISGPTAVGKSSIALEVARRLGGEIIGADSVQVYKGLDVGSAKTPIQDRKGICHHLIDVLHPLEDYSVGDYYVQAREATEQVLERGKVPIVVGGTGMYLRWYLYGAPDTPKSTPEGQALAEKEISKAGGDWDKAVKLLLEAGDTKATSILRNDWYRLRRSFEIIQARGHPRTGCGSLYYKEAEGNSNFKASTADDHARLKPDDLQYDFMCFFLYNSRETLYRIIDERCEEMLTGDLGLLREAAWLLDLGIMPNTSPPSRAIGYRQSMEYFLRCREDHDNISPKEFFSFLADFQKASRNYAKRQLTWFRQEPLYYWLDASKPLEDIVEFIVDAYLDPAILRQASETNGILLEKEATVDKENSLKDYKAKRRHFVHPRDCREVLDWISEMQTRVRDHWLPGASL